MLFGIVGMHPGPATGAQMKCTAFATFWIAALCFTTIVGLASSFAAETSTSATPLDNEANGGRSVDSLRPDPDVLRAMVALPDLLSRPDIQLLMLEGVVVRIDVDAARSPAALSVTADDGTVQGMSIAEYLEDLLGNRFEDVPLEVDTIPKSGIMNSIGMFCSPPCPQIGPNSWKAPEAPSNAASKTTGDNIQLR